MVQNIRKLDRKFEQSHPAEGRCTTRRETGYKPKGTTTTSPGHIPFSPCWYSVGQQLSVSRSLRYPQTIQYLRDDQDSLALLGAVLALLHPQAAVKGLSILRGIQSGAIINSATATLVEEIRRLWPCPLTAFSIISNRETESHRDAKGFTPFYDIITTLGDYTDGRFEVPAIGLRFEYNPGTIVGICGKVLAHGVSEVQGDRFCLVQYFHRKVLDLLCGYPVEPRPYHWMRQEDFAMGLS